MSLEEFINHSRSMITANPATTVSITYSKHKSLKKNTKNTKMTTPKENTNIVKVKVYNPAQGKVVKFKTYKAKELSKLLTHLGPYGVNNDVGIGSLIANKTYEEPIIQGSTATATPTGQEDKKKKKKKGKK